MIAQLQSLNELQQQRDRLAAIEWAARQTRNAEDVKHDYSPAGRDRWLAAFNAHGHAWEDLSAIDRRIELARYGEEIDAQRAAFKADER